MKLITVGDPAATPGGESRQLLSDLFHQLSQPLTTLCCSLALALLQTPAPEQCDEIVRQALGQAEKVSALATAMRELFDAGQAGEDGEILELRRAVEDTVGDLLPVAESAGVRICYSPCSACPVWFDAARLRQGLFHLLGFAVSSGGPGAVVKIELEDRGEEALLGLTLSGGETSAGQSTASSDQELSRRLGLGIARAIFEAAGGSVTVEHSAECRSVEVRLPRKVG
jgi:C4-dicarboxylate-specific signal transduction histidine kinase